MREAGNLVLVGAREPVAFFAYPDKPSLLMAEGARSTKLAGIEDDMQAALEALATELGALRRHLPTSPPRAGPRCPAVRSRRRRSPRSLARCCPRTPSSSTNASRRAASSSPRPPAPAARLAQHQGRFHRLRPAGGDRRRHRLPRPQGRRCSRATAAACTRCRRCGPWRARGSTSPWWCSPTGTYNILRGELTNVGVRKPGPSAVDMLSLRRPDLDWVSLARGMGVEAARAKTFEELVKAFTAGLAPRGLT